LGWVEQASTAAGSQTVPAIAFKQVCNVVFTQSGFTACHGVTTGPAFACQAFDSLMHGGVVPVAVFVALESEK
jgi:hypothetical protein